MIHVRFKRSKHPTMAVDYLLGIDRNRQGAKLIRGDINLSLEIAKQSAHKNKYSCGCLSFEEADIDEKSKHEIMAQFERTLFPGLSENQYNISWVEHTDKGRLELNYFVPQVELSSGKSLTAYFHKTDRLLMRDFTEHTNLSFNLTNPNTTPENATRLNWRKRTPPEVKALGERITQEIISKHPDILSEKQSATVRALYGLGYQIAHRKTGKNKGVHAITRDSISIINPDNPNGPNIRLKGALFGERKPQAQPSPNEVASSLKKRMTIKAEAQRKRYPNLKFNNTINHERTRQNQSIIKQCNQVIARPNRRAKQAEQIQSNRGGYRQWHEQGNHNKVFQRQGGNTQKFTL